MSKRSIANTPNTASPMTDIAPSFDSNAVLEWQICSESNLILMFPKPITLDKQQQCWAMAEVIETHGDVLEVVIGMNTLSVFSQPLSYSELVLLQETLNQISATVSPKEIQGKHIEIPVNYGGEFGPDLKTMADKLSLSVSEIVKLHTKATYTVYFIGFQPGFPYLGGLNEKLYSPRLANPRTNVPAGSVGIGGEQTGIYPFASPGGWQLLGRTETRLFDLNAESPTLLDAGDTLSFIANGIFE